MSRIRSDEAAAALRRRARSVPILTTLSASAGAALLPIVPSGPILPPLGLLVLLAWRMLRPELWPAWVGLPLGLVDDLLGGAPLGSAAALWTASLLLLDSLDQRLMWRDYRHEWLIAAGILALDLAGAAMLAGVVGGGTALSHLLPQYLVSLLAFVPAIRTVAACDRWRLGL